jgi:murein tripeptide amidase MpaA
MEIRFDTYHDNEALAARLAWLCESRPKLAELRSLGRSHEGRDIPLVVLTNKETGPDGDKPAFWVDANIHATEVTASAAALLLVKRLLDDHGRDPKVTRLLDEQAFYIVPRLNPDGAALALAKRPRFLRSGTRPYPFQDRDDGLHDEDMDGDGRILQMRIEDPAGDWRVSEEDPRVMVKRRPDEEGGKYYRLFTEGRVEGYDGHIVKAARTLEGLDFNRNFPGSWRPEGQQRGAGDYPGSEPEIRAVIDFLAKHPNVFGAITYHTFSRAILRPYGTRDDKEMETDDLWVFEAIGRRGTEITGYPCVSVFHDFKYHPKEVITGVFDDWLYDHKGIFAFTVELWDLPTAAGCEQKNKEKKFIEWWRIHPPEDDWKIVRYLDQHAPAGLVPWYPFEHPQLGKVELGGIDFMYTWRNPPPALLEAEIRPHADFAIAFAALAPRLAFRTVEATAVGEGHHRVLAVVENAGFLPTHVSAQAKKMKAVRPVRLEIELPAGATLASSGKRKVEVDQLEGRSNKLSVTSIWSDSNTDNRAKAEWLVHAPAGGTVVVRAISERAGTIRREVSLARS